MSDRIVEIDAQLATLEAERKKLVESKKKEVIVNINDLMKMYDISIDELTAVKQSSPKKAVEAKYKLNDKSWSGRGRLPVFIKEYLVGGGKLEDLLINK